MVKYGKRQQRGGLKESLETSVYISENEFSNSLHNYCYYGYDERCKQILFVCKGNYFTYMWLFIEVE